MLKRKKNDFFYDFIKILQLRYEKIRIFLPFFNILSLPHQQRNCKHLREPIHILFE